MGNDVEFNKFVQIYIKDILPKHSSHELADFRIYIIPYKTNTLAHYIAMYDDLYCLNIYQHFTCNPMFNVAERSFDSYMRIIDQNKLYADHTQYQ